MMDGRSLPVPPAGTAGVAVPVGSERLQIQYTGISLDRPEQVHFRWQLDGYDREWVEAGHTRFAGYSYLPPGCYLFHVAAVNHDGVWE